MLVPGLFFFFTPSFMTNLGCMWVGLVVPAFNSIKVPVYNLRFCDLRFLRCLPLFDTRFFCCVQARRPGWSYNIRHSTRPTFGTRVLS